MVLVRPYCSTLDSQTPKFLVGLLAWKHWLRLRVWRYTNMLAGECRYYDWIDYVWRNCSGPLRLSHLPLPFLSPTEHSDPFYCTPPTIRPAATQIHHVSAERQPCSPQRRFLYPWAVETIWRVKSRAFDLRCYKRYGYYFLYLAIAIESLLASGTIFDVSHKADVYGAGKSYNIFAGKDASKGLGMSSLDPQNAVSDYDGLGEGDMKVLDDWYSFFKWVNWRLFHVRD